MDHFKLTYEIDTEDIHWFQHDQSKWNFKDFYSYRGNKACHYYKAYHIMKLI